MVQFNSYKGTKDLEKLRKTAAVRDFHYTAQLKKSAMIMTL